LSDDGFVAEVEEACRREIEHGPPDFETLITRLRGADPVLVIETLQGLQGRLDGADGLVRRLLEESRGDCPQPPSPLPIPHPLDYAWPFTPESLDLLTSEIGTLTDSGELIAYLGAPSAHRAAGEALPDRHHLLLDRDQRQVEAANEREPGSAMRIDLCRDELPTVNAALCLADPPWYPDEMSAFGNGAAHLLAPGGSLIQTFPEKLTRPGLAADRARVLADAERDGLSFDRSQGQCAYLTPPFEYAALAAAGLTCPPQSWRSAELLRFTKGLSRPRRRRLVSRESWLPVEIHEIPLRVRTDAAPVGTGLITSLIDGDVLPTVSRRDPRRRQAALWTSRNRIFGSSDPPALAELLADLAAGRMPDDEDLSPIAARLIEIVDLERRENQIEQSDRAR
jgi:hypothetical protein